MKTSFKKISKLQAKFSKWADEPELRWLPVESRTLGSMADEELAEKFSVPLEMIAKARVEGKLPACKK